MGKTLQQLLIGPELYWVSDDAIQMNDWVACGNLERESHYIKKCETAKDVDHHNEMKAIRKKSLENGHPFPNQVNFLKICATTDIRCTDVPRISPQDYQSYLNGNTGDVEVEEVRVTDPECPIAVAWWPELKIDTNGCAVRAEEITGRGINELAQAAVKSLEIQFERIDNKQPIRQDTEDSARNNPVQESSCISPFNG